MTKTYFPFVEKVNYEGTESNNPLSFKYYDPDKMVLGKKMSEHLRVSVCMWHTMGWQGNDAFGANTFTREWKTGSDITRAKNHVDAVFEFARKLNAPFISLHDEDILPFEHTRLTDFFKNLDEMVDYVGKKMDDTGIGLLLGTANLFSLPCFASGAATNPDPEVFTFAAAKVKNMMEKTKTLDGQNYVLWGGRDGYNSLINTNLSQELDQLGRFVSMVVNHKHKIGYKGALLIEPKPCEPTKHQYDFDVATVYGFLAKYGLENEVKVNIEANHATLAGHSFEHEVAYACALGILGSIDANRGDPQNGWDTDQFPNSINELSFVLQELLAHGGFDRGGFNFDSKIRRESMEIEDLFYSHIGGMDALAKSLLVAERMIQDQFLKNVRDERYKGWSGDTGRAILQGEYSLDQLSQIATQIDKVPTPVSGRQELRENQYNRYVW